MRYGFTQEPLDDDERELMDPDHWDWDSAVEGVPMPNVGAIIEIDFTREKIGPLQRLAHSQGMTAHAFIKQAALDRVLQDAALESAAQPSDGDSTPRRHDEATMV